MPAMMMMMYFPDPDDPSYQQAFHGPNGLTSELGKNGVNRSMPGNTMLAGYFFPARNLPQQTVLGSGYETLTVGAAGS